jgi:error-prone DNA polymerase
LKRHHPAAFCAALLDSQPMGFYAPAQLVRDAREHGVEVRPADVNHSDWNCSLEEGLGPRPSGPVLRLGLRMIRGLSEAAAHRIAEARRAGAFSDVRDLVRRAALDRGDLKVLASADALSGVTGHRHLAAWQVAGVEDAADLAGLDRFNEQLPLLAAPSTGQAVLADYAQTGLTLREHPLALIRAQLCARGFLRADQIAERAPGQIVRAAGLVLIRQRPGNGRAIFVTLEDESGGLNLLIWADLAERQRRVLLGAQLLGAVAEIQRADGVQHLMCRRLEDHSDLLNGLQVTSRDFQ